MNGNICEPQGVSRILLPSPFASSKTKCNKRVSLSERCRRSRCVARGCLHLSERKKKQPAIQIKKETEVSQRLTNFVLQMYHQLISEQRSQIFALLPKKQREKELPTSSVLVSQHSHVKSNTTARLLESISGRRRMIFVLETTGRW